MLTDTGGVLLQEERLRERRPRRSDHHRRTDRCRQGALTSGRQKGLFLGNDGGIGAAGGPLVWSAGTDYLTADNTPGFNTELVATGFAKLKELNDSGTC